MLRYTESLPFTHLSKQLDLNAANPTPRAPNGASIIPIPSKCRLFPVRNVCKALKRCKIAMENPIFSGNYPGNLGFFAIYCPYRCRWCTLSAKYSATIRNLRILVGLLVVLTLGKKLLWVHCHICLNFLDSLSHQHSASNLKNLDVFLSTFIFMVDIHSRKHSMASR